MAGLFTEKLPQDFLKFFWLDGNHPVTQKSSSSSGSC